MKLTTKEWIAKWGFLCLMAFIAFLVVAPFVLSLIYCTVNGYYGSALITFCICSSISFVGSIILMVKYGDDIELEIKKRFREFKSDTMLERTNLNRIIYPEETEIQDTEMKELLHITHKLYDEKDPDNPFDWCE